MQVFRQLSPFIFLLIGSFVPAHGAEVSELFQADVAAVSGQEIVVLEVQYAASAKSASHRHNAHAVVYVLEGSVIMQVEGGEQKTLVVGDVFYEAPDDIHTVSMNASDTEPARILVYFLRKKNEHPNEPASQ